MKKKERGKNKFRGNKVYLNNKSTDILVITLVTVSLFIALFGLGLYLSLDGSSTASISDIIDNSGSGQQTGFVSLRIIELPPQSGDQE